MRERERVSKAGYRIKRHCSGVAACCLENLFSKSQQSACQVSSPPQTTLLWPLGPLLDGSRLAFVLIGNMVAASARRLVDVGVVLACLASKFSPFQPRVVFEASEQTQILAETRKDR